MAHTPTQRVFLHPGNRAKAQVSMRSKIRGSVRKNARPKLTVAHRETGRGDWRDGGRSSEQAERGARYRQCAKPKAEGTNFLCTMVL